MKSKRSLRIAVMITLFISMLFLYTGCSQSKGGEQGRTNGEAPLDGISSSYETILELKEEKQIKSRMMVAKKKIEIDAGASGSKVVINKGDLVRVVGKGSDQTQVLYKDELVYVNNADLTQTLTKKNWIIVLDAGHQRKSDLSLEPIGPGAQVMKPKLRGGTRGVQTRIFEYVLNLEVTLKLQDELLNRGYDVRLVRETHDVNISNAQRAIIANELEADCYIRIHANGDNDASRRGIMTICQTPENPYNGDLFEYSSLLAKSILDASLRQTGLPSQGVWETDTMTGINWCRVPTTIIEMGYMSNPIEDVLLNSKDFQEKVVLGIADGIELYFSYFH